MKICKIPGPFRVPSWILPLFTTVFCEIVLYLWTVETFSLLRLLTVTVFALGSGGILGFFTSLFRGTRSKWVAGILSVLVAALTVTEYLIEDMFQVFMAPETVAAGAAGVVTDYSKLMFRQIFRHLPHIVLVLLPIVLFCVMTRPARSRKRSRVGLAVGAAAMCTAAVLLVNALGQDARYFRESYHFDSAVRRFGLYPAFVLDAVNNSGLAGDTLEFQPVETQPPTSGATEPSAEASSEPGETAGETTEPVTEPVTEPEPVYVEQVLPIDFAALAQSERDGDIAALHSYVASQTPSMTNAYTGLFAGKNLIFITAEAFTGTFISEELTPTLYRLATRGIEFTDYYQPTWGASTTGGEYSNLIGLVPKGGSCMKEACQQTLFLTIGSQLQKLGYSSAAFHNNSYTYYDRNKTHTYLGYDYFMGYGNGMEKGVAKNWPQSDLEMMDYTVDLYLDRQPFSVYYMSVSGHCDYNSDNDMAAKNFALTAQLDYSETVKYYIASQLELEAALTSLLSRLEEAGILDDTVIVVASDHYPYGLETDGDRYLKELYGTDTINDFTRDRNTLIIWSGCIEDRDIVVDDPVMSLDILPTLSNLFGVAWDSRLLPGRDVFSDADPLVFWSISGSWKTDLGSYNAATKVFTPAQGVEVEDGYVEAMQAIVSNKLKYSRAVAANDYFNYVYAALPDEE